MLYHHSCLERTLKKAFEIAAPVRDGGVRRALSKHRQQYKKATPVARAGAERKCLGSRELVGIPGAFEGPLAGASVRDVQAI